MIIELFPTVRPSRGHLIEDAVEAIETLGEHAAFTINDVVDVTHRSPRRVGAARQTPTTLELEGLIRRVSPPRARPTLYAVNLTSRYTTSAQPDESLI